MNFCLIRGCDCVSPNKVLRPRNKDFYFWISWACDSHTNYDIEVSRNQDSEDAVLRSSYCYLSDFVIWTCNLQKNVRIIRAGDSSGSKNITLPWICDAESRGICNTKSSCPIGGNTTRLQGKAAIFYQFWLGCDGLGWRRYRRYWLWLKC